MAQTFAGKRVFLTGAASGIGRATALKLAAEGAELYLTDRDAAGLETTVSDVRALGGTVAEHRALDIADYDEVARFGADIHTSHRSMDIVMNIAGVSAWGTVEQLTHKQWSSMVSINLMGPIHVIETFLPPMVAAGRGGHLVNVSSAAGLVALPWHCGLQRKQIRAARPLGGVAVRPRPPSHRGVGGRARGRQHPVGEHRRDRRRRPGKPAGAAPGQPVHRPCRRAGEWSRTRFLPESARTGS